MMYEGVSILQERTHLYISKRIHYAMEMTLMTYNFQKESLLERGSKCVFW